MTGEGYTCITPYVLIPSSSGRSFEQTKPSTKLDIGSVLTGLTHKQLQDYQRRAFKATFGEGGPAELLKAFGLKENEYALVEGSGGYMGDLAPNQIVMVRTDKDTARRIALAWMYIFRQDSVPFFRADEGLAKDKSAAQGLKIIFKEALTPKNLRRFFDHLRSQVDPRIGITKTGNNEAVVINFLREDFESDSPISDEVFLERMMTAIQDAPVEVELTSQFGAETEYPYHGWDEQEGPERLLSAAAAGRPALQERLDHWADAFRRYAQAEGAEIHLAREGPPERDVAAPIPLDRSGRGLQRAIYGRFGRVEDDLNTVERLKIYKLQPLVEDPSKTQKLLDRLGFKEEYFSFEENPEKGVKWRVPDFKRKNYAKGYVWIYDPRNAHGSFMDVEYTRQWRLVHEAGHGS